MSPSASQYIPFHPVHPSTFQCIAMHSSVSQCTQCIPLPCSASHHIAVHPVSSTSPIAFHCPQSLPVPPSAPQLSPQSPLPLLSPSGLAQGPGSIPAGLCPHSLASPSSLHAHWDVCPVLALLRDGAIPPPASPPPSPQGTVAWTRWAPSRLGLVASALLQRQLHRERPVPARGTLGSGGDTRHCHGDTGGGRQRGAGARWVGAIPRPC